MNIALTRTFRSALVLTPLVFPATTIAQSPRTQIVMLGTGTPIPDPDRGGPAVAIVVDSVAYLFDAGTGVVRRAARISAGAWCQQRI